MYRFIRFLYKFEFNILSRFYEPTITVALRAGYESTLQIQ